jgi:hypothetical protein
MRRKKKTTALTTAIPHTTTMKSAPFILHPTNQKKKMSWRKQEGRQLIR